MPAKKTLTEGIKDAAKSVSTRAKKAAEEAKDALTAAEIETKKKARSSSRKVKEKVDAAAANTAEKASDVKAAAEIEAKKRAGKASRKAGEIKAVADAAKKEAGKPVRKARAAKINFVIQSPMGGSITPEEIAEKVGNVDSVYIRVDQNKAYWVRGEETGNVDLW